MGNVVDIGTLGSGVIFGRGPRSGDVEGDERLSRRGRELGVRPKVCQSLSLPAIIPTIDWQTLDYTAVISDAPS
jgi:hypothetical protein